MNMRSNDSHAAFDDDLRRHHAQAVASLSARTQAQLQLRRRSASTRGQVGLRAYAWPLAAACAVGLLAIGLQWRQADVRVAAPTRVVVGPGNAATDAPSANDGLDAYAMFDEAPDLYLWLASDDAAALAME